MFLQIKEKVKVLGEMEYLEYIEENRKKMYMALAAAAAWCFLASTTYFILIRPSIPGEVAKDYVGYLRAKNYAKVCEYFEREDGNEIPGEDYIGAVLEGIYGHASYIHIKESIKSTDGSTYDVAIEVGEGGKNREEHISLVSTGPGVLGLGKVWKVVFPFGLKDITVTGVDGSEVFVDGIPAGKIKGGELLISDVIMGERKISAILPDMGQTDSLEVEVRENTDVLDLKVKPFEGFREKIDECIYEFCQAWSQYCMSQDSKALKSYLTDRLFEEYTGSLQLFDGSRYEVCQFTVHPRELFLDNVESIFYTVDEKWHLKEVITDPELVFQDNNKTELEQIQHISWKYHMVNEGGFWKIDSAEQLAFEQEIKS